MIFDARGGRALAGIEAGLTRSDPVLAARFEGFNARCWRSPVEQERQPGRPARSKKPLAIVLLPLALLLLSWYAVAGAGDGSSRGCSTVAVAMCPGNQTSGRAAGASAHQEIGARASAIHSPPNAP
jgi:hypothetical protein